MCECLHLRKPMLVVLVQGQFEQQMNATYYAKLGYGATHRFLTTDVVLDYVDRLDEYEARIE